VLGEAFHFVQRQAQAVSPQATIDARWEPAGNDEYQVVISADRFLHGVCLTADGYLPDDNYFHLGPQRSKRVRFRPLGANRPAFAADLESLNLASTIAITRRVDAVK
jgi:beta-mannosidase